MATRPPDQGAGIPDSRQPFPIDAEFLQHAPVVPNQNDYANSHHEAESPPDAVRLQRADRDHQTGQLLFRNSGENQPQQREIVHNLRVSGARSFSNREHVFQVVTRVGSESDQGLCSSDSLQ